MFTTAPNGVRFHQFESLLSDDLVHATFTRRGGVSPAPWDSLNVGGSVNDERERVIENRRRSFEALDLPFDSIADLWLVHSAETVLVERPNGAAPYLGKADALVTDRPGVSLYLRFADCVPILLYDPRRRAVGIVHAGWRGTVLGAAQSAVAAMARALGSRPEDIRAGIGPSIGPCHYAVGPEVVAQVHTAFPGPDGLLRQRDGQTFFDLWSANRRALHEAGVQEIESAGLCTVCHPQDWYSHRGQRGRTGRFGAVIALRR